MGTILYAQRSCPKIPSHFRLYGKLEAKHNRKMGHVTVFSDKPDEVEEF